MLYSTVQKEAKTKLMLSRDVIPRTSVTSSLPSREMDNNQARARVCLCATNRELIDMDTYDRATNAYISNKKNIMMKKKNKGKDTILAIYFQKRNKKLVLKLQHGNGDWKVQNGMQQTNSWRHFSINYHPHHLYSLGFSIPTYNYKFCSHPLQFKGCCPYQYQRFFFSLFFVNSFSIQCIIPYLFFG